MIAPAIPSHGKSAPAWHAPFLAMMPLIVRYARIALCHLKPEARQDAVEEVVASAMIAYARLVELGKAELAYPSALARYAVAQFRHGRRVGNRLRIGDVLSPYAQTKKRFTVERLDHFDEDEGCWMEAVVEDTRTPPPDQAAFRIDFTEWLARQSPRDRQIAESLAVGHRPGEVAGRLGISPGRVSQLRRQLRASWADFQGESTAPAAASA